MWIPLTHLQRLEAEAIHIFREVAANFAKPVMLYSVGKDSSVLLHLAMKAFYPGQAAVSVPACRHDLEVPRDDRVPRRRWRPGSASICSSTSTRTACAQDINPFDSRLQHPHPGHEDRGAAPGARQIRLRRGLRRRPPRRGEVARQGAHLLLPQRAAMPGTPRTSGRRCGRSTTPASSPGESIRVFPLSNWTELDIWQYILQEDIPIVPLYFAKERPVVERDGMLIMVDDERMKLRPGEAVGEPHGALPHARLLSADRRHRVRRRPASKTSSARC